MFKFLKRLREKKAAQQEAQPVALEVEIAAPEQAETPTPKVPEDKVKEPPNPAPEPQQPAEEPKAVAPVKGEEVKQPRLTEPPSEQAQVPEAALAVEEVELPARSLKKGVRSLFANELDLEDLEDILIQADFGIDTAEEIEAELRSQAKKLGSATEAENRLLLRDILSKKLARDDLGLNLSDGKLPYVFLVVGVNGAGKTTTIGKLARWLRDGEWVVTLGAADTFRAAAVEQLATWAERASASIVRPEREGQDPASVAYQTVELAIKEEADIAIIDTAGRLQSKKDLMDELAKIRRAVEKLAQINEVLLVIDATTGQNALAQAKAFTEVADVTGIVMTKLDGTAKGGILYQIQEQLNIPVKLVGVGEGVNDFAFFSAEEFANGLVARRD